MGMAASQARYLGLTARKTNVEYEGQQINQARTALANQSANLFNQLLAMSVPTPPSTADFTTVQYSYTDGINSEAISSMTELINDPEGYNYNVTHYHYADIYRGQQQLITNPQVFIDETVTPAVPKYVGNCELTKYTDAKEKSEEAASVLEAAYKQIKSDWPNSVFATTPEDQIYIYENAGRTYFTTWQALKDSWDSAPDKSKPIENQATKLVTYYADSNKEKVEKTEKALVEVDGSGRATTIRFKDSSAVFTLNTETITDDKAYQDAMNQYTYNVNKYQKEIEDINAKTKKIQEEDRTLELRLKQLDTEQEALQTEMEAVKKVIDKNIENTFKTFE